MKSEFSFRSRAGRPHVRRGFQLQITVIDKTRVFVGHLVTIHANRRDGRACVKHVRLSDRDFHDRVRIGSNFTNLYRNKIFIIVLFETIRVSEISNTKNCYGKIAAPGPWWAI